jgi:hypothetical protein
MRCFCTSLAWLSRVRCFEFPARLECAHCVELPSNFDTDVRNPLGYYTGRTLRACFPYGASDVSMLELPSKHSSVAAFSILIYTTRSRITTWMVTIQSVWTTEIPRYRSLSQKQAWKTHPDKIGRHFFSTHRCPVYLNLNLCILHESNTGRLGYHSRKPCGLGRLAQSAHFEL